MMRFAKPPRGLLLGFALVLPLSALAGEEAAGLQQIDVFEAGKEGYHTFRIPSVLVTPRGTVLAFCEGRKQGQGDSGDIDLVMKRSNDGGQTWSPLQVIVDDGPNTVGNPCPVVDRASGTIWMPLTHNLGEDKEPQILDGTSRGTRSVWLIKSNDDGASWSKPIDLTAAVKAPNWTWYATGPGVSIQLASGRLLVPCDHYVAGTKAAEAHIIYSDDAGASWKLGGTVGGGVNECQAVELAEGSVLLNLRNQPRRPGEGRAVALSRDGGLTFTPPTRDPALPEPGCQASLLRYSRPSDREGGLLLFSNPASSKRERMTIRASTDEARSWSISRVIHEGPSAYSCLTVLPDRTIGCLYERGHKSPYEKITFARLTLSWLKQGR
ncbi:MAG: exo-alpha-sialidase [Isosphaeraceae bacterium]|nr:exo-alpha-sialidase [Isosphaeraceae bacterium]